ncbi:MAG: gliding motility-associated ABC transporter substrate-binding protein GldG [Prevotellaceae bacterium]|jgi:gliding-associated putative ABC transporter substrate-binding component GldG|nr:gliding motility-associated ABC transporter substrate-binding protein GldG [Prevotellaceae bacterium]
MKKSLNQFAILLLLVFAFGIFAEKVRFRIDLTSDKRYTLSEAGRQTMKDLDDVVFVLLYLDGEMPVQMKKFRTSVGEKLDELGRYAGTNLQYEFRNPSEGGDENRKAVYDELISMGVRPLTVHENSAEGGTSQRMLFPGAKISYKGKQMVVNLIQQNPLFSAEENLNFALQNLEYEIVNTIQKLSGNKEKRIAFIEGHGELDDSEAGDIIKELSEYYTVERLSIDGEANVLDDYDAVIIAKPLTRWPEADKFVLDQYIMQGGKTAWFIDAVQVYEDSLTRGETTVGMLCEHNLNDQLFDYGVRVNPNVIRDLQCARRLINIAPAGMSADLRLVPWTYFPLLWPPPDNAITKGLNLVYAQYPGVIDTVGRNTEIKKKFLLYSSDKSQTINAPMLINLSQIKDKISPERFNLSYLPVAVLLEGIFDSPFHNRMVGELLGAVEFKSKSKPTKMVIVSDGDVIRNEVSRRSTRTSVYPLGYDRNTNMTYGNKDFVKNIINYLLDESGLMEIRSRNFQMRLIDKVKVAQHKTQIILVNTVLPPTLIIVLGLIFIWFRRRKFIRLF